MRARNSVLFTSATDLANFLGCRHLTALDREVAEGRRETPRWLDPALAILSQRGFVHEAAYLDHLRAAGRTVTELSPGQDAKDRESPPSAHQRTVEAMRSGADVIAQATLSSQRWLGRADVLLRVDRASALGGYSYEVVDTKLAQETRGGTILQLCLYSAMVSEIQGLDPNRMHVVAPGRGFEPESFRVEEYQAYFRLVRRRLQEALADPADLEKTYPDPVPQCDVCRWWVDCDRRRHGDDHLCLVAGITRSQTREIQSWGIPTLAGLSTLPLPLSHRPRRGSPASYVKVREQARLQFAGRNEGRPVHELLALEPGRGLAMLPAPSPGISSSTSRAIHSWTKAESNTSSGTRIIRTMERSRTKAAGA
jgi:uncharacterized protein